MKPIHVIMAISVPVIWGIGFIIAKAAMEHFSPILLMALRFTLTVFCLIWFFRPPLSMRLLLRYWFNPDYALAIYCGPEYL